MKLNRLLIVSLAIACILLQVGVFGAFYWWVIEVRHAQPPATLAVVFGSILWATILHAKRLAAPSGIERIANDTRPPVLYLRSFVEDDPEDLIVRLDLDYHSRERMVCDVLSEIGPVVAIGKPGETLPPLGAARVYVQDGGDWQMRFKELLGKAKLVVISGGATNGLLWEIKQVFDIFPSERVILLLPIMTRTGFTKKTIEKNKNKSNSYLFEKLRLASGVQVPSAIGNSYLLLFDKRRHAYVPEMLLHTRSYNFDLTGKILFAEAIRPYQCRLGIKLKPLNRLRAFVFYSPSILFFLAVILLTPFVLLLIILAIATAVVTVKHILNAW